MDEKPWWTSKTLWTQIVGTVAAVATAAGVHVLDDPATQAMAVTMAIALLTAVFRLTSKPTALK
jgi:uncharacterized membrane protein YgaE (UPF0421/DUF939 family)